MLVQPRRRSPPRLPDQVTLVHGPHQILGRFILLADRAARERGIFLSLESDFDSLLELNEANRDHWHPLAPSFDPRNGGVNADNGFWIVGRNEDGEAVLTQVVRHFPMQETSLTRELETLRFFYGDPVRQASAGESCVSSASTAAKICGSVVYSGGTWFRPDFRGRGLASIVPRIGRAIALSRWNTDYAFSNSAAGAHLEFALVWIAQDDFVFDLETTMVLHS
jgi:hypothetical protein